MKKWMLIALGMALSFQSINAEELVPFSLKRYGDQKVVTSKDYNDKGLVINFFASWCTACLKEMAELEQLKKTYSQQFHFIAINAGENNKHIDKLLRRHKFSYEILLDPDKIYSKSIGVEKLPHTMVINTKGEIVYSSELPPKELSF